MTDPAISWRKIAVTLIVGAPPGPGGNERKRLVSTATSPRATDLFIVATGVQSFECQGVMGRAQPQTGERGTAETSSISSEAYELATGQRLGSGDFEGGKTGRRKSA